MDGTRTEERRFCVCGGEMRPQGKYVLQLSGMGLFEMASYAAVELYICPNCRRGDFFFPQDLVGDASGERNFEFNEAYYREQYENDSTAALRKSLGEPYLPEQIKEVIRTILAERGEGERAEEPERARPDPWKEKTGKKGLFSSLFGDDDEKPKKNRPPEF